MTAAAMAGILLAGTAAADLQIPYVQAEGDTHQTAYVFDFDSGIDGWSYGTGWEYQYNGEIPTVEADAENGRMKITVDFSRDADKGWSNIAVCWWNNAGLDLSGATQISMDVWYETEKLTEGELKIAAYSNCGLDVNTGLSDPAQEEGTGLTKA